MKNTLTISIASPEQIIWEGKGIAVSSVNSVGPFDVLPHHANFITIIENKPVVIDTGTKRIQFTFPVCVLYARDNYVYAYTL